MHSLVEVSTEGLALKDRLGLWSETVVRNIGGLRSESYGAENFNGRVVATTAGHVRLCRLEATSHRVVRTSELIRQSEEVHLKIVAQLQGQTHFQQGGREVWLSPGEWSVYDTSRAYTVTNPGSVEQLIVMIPKSRLPEVQPCESGVVYRLSGRHGIGRLAWDAMLSLYQELPVMSQQAAAGTADVLTELVHLSLIDLQGRSSTVSLRKALHDRIVGHVARHLCDPELRVASIAHALNCSRRHLYNAFVNEEDGLAGYILRERATHFSKRQGLP